VTTRAEMLRDEAFKLDEASRETQRLHNAGQFEAIVLELSPRAALEVAESLRKTARE
jgi:hypothetical protein